MIQQTRKAILDHAKTCVIAAFAVACGASSDARPAVVPTRDTTRVDNVFTDNG